MTQTAPVQGRAAPPDLYVVSDLHLSAGRSDETGRTSRLETFFYDQEFANLVDRVRAEAVRRSRPVVFVLNGDAFDFLAVTQTPSHEERRRLGIHVSRREQRFGMDNEPVKDAWKMRRIVRGHPVFFLALLRLVADGHRVHVNRGNHDIELYWRKVREACHEELEALAGREGLDLPPEELRARFAFHEWFYHEPGRIWIEHGHQYEASNSLRYVLNPVVGSGRPGGKRLDLPTGSMFVRYVYNRFKLVDPYTAQIFTLEQYLDVLGAANAIDLGRALTVQLPFFVRALKNTRILEMSGMREVAGVHERRLSELAERSGLGDRLRRIDRLRKFPMGLTKYTLFRDMMKPIVRNVLTILLLVLLSIGGWMLLFTLISSTGWLVDSVFGKASLMGVLAVVTVVGLFLLGSFFSRRYRRMKDSIHDVLSERAGRISELLDVPLVVMGHSHGVERRPLRGGRGGYANSGTWTVVRGPWDTVRPFGRQFTFARVLDDQLDVLRWNDPAGRWEPVTFLEEHEPTGLDRFIAETDRTKVPGRERQRG